MKKIDMISLDDAVINEQNKSKYFEFYDIIFDTINETYRYLFYLEGIKEFFGENYHLKGRHYEYFIKDILVVLKQKICLNIWKLLMDCGKGTLSIYKMKKTLYDEFKCSVNVKNIKINSDLEKSIKGIRNTSISHNLHTDIEYTLEMRDLKVLLGQTYQYFQKLWVKNLVGDNRFIADGYFEELEHLYKDSVKSVLKGIIA